MALSSGLGFYNHAVLIQALAQTGNFSVTTASSAVSLFFIVSGLSGLLIAPILERVDARWIICSGAIVSAVGLALLSSVTTLLQLYLVYFLFGVGFSASGLLPATTLITRLFFVCRARALSIASTGLSVGGMLITPLSAVWVVSMDIGPATRLMAIVYALGIIPLTIWLVRSRPEEVGENPDGVARIQPIGSLAASDGTPFVEAIRDNFYKFLNISYVFIMIGQVGGIAHQVGIISERLSQDHVVGMLTILPIASVAGRLAGGFLLEHLQTLIFTLGMIILQVL